MTQTRVQASDILAELDVAVKHTGIASVSFHFDDIQRAYLSGAHDSLSGFRRLVRSEMFALRVEKSNQGVPHDR